MAASPLPVPAGTLHRGWHAVSTLCQAEIKKKGETTVQKLTQSPPNGYCPCGLYAEAHITSTQCAERHNTKDCVFCNCRDFLCSWDWCELSVSATARSMMLDPTTWGKRSYGHDLWIQKETQCKTDQFPILIFKPLKWKLSTKTTQAAGVHRFTGNRWSGVKEVESRSQESTGRGLWETRLGLATLSKTVSMWLHPVLSSLNTASQPLLEWGL